MLITKPIIFIYLQTTGGNISKDRIVQICCIKIDNEGDGVPVPKEVLINPKIPIPDKAKSIHGIDDEMVKNAKTFAEISKSFFTYLYGCDIAGYNSEATHIPMLVEEFARCGIEFPTWEMAIVDVMKYDQILMPNNFSRVYNRYVEKPFAKSPNGMDFARGTMEILISQITSIGKEELSPQEIDLECQGSRRRFDLSGKAYIDQNNIVRWAIGKHIDEPVLETPSYIDYVFNNPFPHELKVKLKKLIESNKQP